MAFVLDFIEPDRAGFRVEQIERVSRLIDSHIAEGRYPGAQVALARHGKLAFTRNYGLARIEPAIPARDDTVWRLYSNTKVLTAAAIWILVEEGALSFNDQVAEHVPEFARHGKGGITVLQVLTHQAGFPNAPVMPPEAWEDHQFLRRLVCDYTLEWTPGSRLHYHTSSTHWVLAVVIEAIAKMDFRDFIRNRVIEPLGLGDELYVGIQEADQRRCAEIYEPGADGKPEPIAAENTVAFRRAGIPSGGGFGTARAMVAFYQMMLAGGTLNGRHLISPRMVQYVTRNFTGESVDAGMGNVAMHRGLGPHSRGTSNVIRGLGSLAHPATFGHGGVGTSYCWADPDSGVSFAYIANNRIPDPWHSRRLELISNCIHAAIEEIG